MRPRASCNSQILPSRASVAQLFRSIELTIFGTCEQLVAGKVASDKAREQTVIIHHSSNLNSIKTDNSSFSVPP